MKRLDMLLLLCLLCVAHTSIAQTADAPVNIDGIFYQLNYADKTASVAVNWGTDKEYTTRGDFVIPSNIEAWNLVSGLTEPFAVTSIGRDAFKGHPYIRSLQLGGSIRSIGACALMNTHVKTVVLSNNIESLSDSAFMYCDSLTDIFFPSQRLTAIGTSAFEGSGLKILRLSAGINNFGQGAFRHCADLKTVVMENGMQILGEEMFYGCEQLTAVNLPPFSLKDSALGKGAFAWCTQLETINLSNSLTVIPERAFYGCERLQLDALPSQLTGIGASAFAHCTQLKDTLHIPASVSEIGDSAFAWCSRMNAVYVPWMTPSAHGLAFGEDIFYGIEACNLHTAWGAQFGLIWQGIPVVRTYRVVTDVYVTPPTSGAPLGKGVVLGNIVTSGNDLVSLDTAYCQSDSKAKVRVALMKDNLEAQHFHFQGWQAGDNLLSTDTVFTCTIEQDTALTAVFRKDSCRLTLTVVTDDDNLTSDDVAITLTKNGTSVNEVGTTNVSIAMVEPEGYDFIGWDAEGNNREDVFIDILPASLSLEAYFARKTYTLNVSAEGDAEDNSGNITILLNDTEEGQLMDYGEYVQTAPYGTEVTLRTSLINENDYEFAYWEMGATAKIQNESRPTEYSAEGEVKFILTQDSAVRAFFREKQLHHLSVVTSPTGGTVREKEITGYAGTIVQLKAIPATGYFVQHWIRIEADGSSGAPLGVNATELTATIPNRDVTYFLYFSDGTAAGDIDGDEAAVSYTEPVLRLLHLNGYKVSVLTPSGRLLHRGNVNADDAQIVLPLPRGIYILHAVKGREKYVVKLIVR